MENYNIYDEIGRGAHSFVYKARRKRSIEYVAVKSTAKSRMDKILNEVPFLHKLNSSHVLRFHDWYESSNHIWLILEYCMGGDLLNLITQDKQLPEATVQCFGSELVRGLQYLHFNSILYCDLKPATILIDEFGSLKLADFGLARRIPGRDAALTRPLAPGSPHYMAPELFQRPAVHSFASDFWALGCVLYELKTGRQPFTHTNFSELARIIQTEIVELPVAGCEMSPTFCDLLQRLLVKDPYQRITWDKLVDHPFWNPSPRLEKLAMPRQEKFDLNARSSLKGQSNNYTTSHNFTDNLKEMQPDVDNDKYQINHKDHEDDGDNNRDDKNRDGNFQSPRTNPCKIDSDHSDAKLDKVSQINDEARPVSAPSHQSTLQNSTEDVNYDHDAILGDSTELINLHHRWRANNAPHSAPPVFRHTSNRRLQLHNLFDRDGSGLRKISKLVFAAADCRVKSIIGNKDIQVEDLPRVHADLVQFTLTSPEDLLSCSTEALENQLKEIYVSLKSSQELAKLSILTYLFTLSCHARLAHVIVNSSILKLLIRMLAQETRTSNMSKAAISMLCLVLGILFRFATFIAPSSPDQFQLLVTSLLGIIDTPYGEADNTINTKLKEMQPRPLALACLGELLFYISTQHEWELPMEGVETILACMEDADVAARFYSVRTLGNMLIHCTNSLLSHLITENIVLTLMRGLSQFATRMSSNDSKEQEKIVALQTAIAEALAQVLRHFRTPSSFALLSSRLKRSVLLFFAKPDLLHAVWRGVQPTQGTFELTIASLNIINAFLDIKLSTDSETESAAIKASRSLLLDRIVTMPVICKVLEPDKINGRASHDGESLTILQAKGLILLYLGVHLNRGFLSSFVQHNLLDTVEKILDPIAHHYCAHENKLQSTETKLSANEFYLAQCAFNMCKLSIRTALKLGAICFSTHENEQDNARSLNNGEHHSRKISPFPFQLFSDLLRNSNCRHQLFDYFVSNDSKQYTFFLRLMTRLLLSFSDEVVDIPGNAEASTTIAQYVSNILLELFEHARKEANDIVNVEQLMLFNHLLPEVVKHVDGITTESRDRVAVTCLRILRVVLLDFDYKRDNDDNEIYESFIRTILVPHFNALFKGPHGLDEMIWTLTSELLHGLLSTNPSLFQRVNDVDLALTIMALLRIPDKFHSMPLHTTQLVQLLLDSNCVSLESLYESGLAKSVISGLTFASKRKVLDESLLALMVILLTLLQQQNQYMQQPGFSCLPFEFDELVSCGPLLLHICAWSGQNVAPENEPDDIEEKKQITDEFANVASRCLLLLSQIFGEDFNKVMFSQSQPLSSTSDDSVSSSLARCLQINTNGVVLLRVLLTLKSCLCCKTTCSYVSRWILKNGRVFNLIMTLASQTQSFRSDETAKLSVEEQILKIATAVTRLCSTSDSR